SLNIPSVKIANALGVKKIADYAEKMDISYENDDLSVAVGNLSGGITVRQLLSAYTTLTDGGNYTKASAIMKITDEKGRTVYEKKRRKTRVFSQGTAYIINDMLIETPKKGTAKKIGTTGYEVCAKTGTNGSEEGNTDAYCVAYTPEYIVVVWIGRKDSGLVENSISGGSYPAAIAADTLKAIYGNNKPSTFRMPEDVTSVEIDKTSYESDGKLLKCNSNSDKKISFPFLKGTEPKETKKQIMPVIKNYKITYDKPNIIISLETSNGAGYKLYDSDGNEIFTSLKAEEEYRCHTEKGKNEYIFYASAYTVENGQEILGEKIKLPSVVTEGIAEYDPSGDKKRERRKRITDERWWEYP
ncbi:MAG: hypothetical protein IJS67_03205, partial [Clostridia bacterium]|nr:hypothetical protein [Clostridia bacterium]